MHANVTQLTRLGDTGAAATGDEITTVADYFPNTTAYIVNRAARAVDYAGTSASGTKLAETRTCYDGAAPGAGGCPTPPPTAGDPTTVEQWLKGTTDRYLASHATYDGFGNVISQSDPLNNITSFIYDTTYHLFVTETRDPLYSADNRHKTTATWDFVCALPTETRDLNDQPTKTGYDALCRARQVKTPSNAVVCTNYFNIGSPGTQYIETQTPPPAPESPASCDLTNATTFTFAFTPGGNLWSRSYMDGLGRIYRTSSEGPGGSQTAIETLTGYNARGAVASATAPYYSDATTQYTTSWKYDALDRKIEKRHPDGNTLTQSFGVSAVAKEIETATVVDELGRSTTTHGDAYGRTVQVDEQFGGSAVVTKYQYDLLGRLTDLFDHYSNQWSYTYDSLGRRTQAVDPDLGTWNYTYDDAGRLTLQTDALAPAQRTVLTYDALGRVLTKKAREGLANQETTTYTYDFFRAGFFNVGHQTTASNTIGTPPVPIATIDYNFDQEGRPVGQTYTVPGETPSTYTFATSYDLGGRLLSQAYPDNDSVGPLTYDAAGRLKSVPDILATAGILYDARGNQTNIARANATTTAFGYSPQRGWLLTQLTSNTTATPLQDATYTRDALGRITVVTSSLAGEGWTYGYDDLDRLLSADNATDNSLDQTFTYDLVGNMLTNSKVGTYGYGAQGPGKVRPHATTGVSGGPLGTQSFFYDGNGSMTCQGGSGPTLPGRRQPPRL
jgi:YD repeat-containing protein